MLCSQVLEGIVRVLRGVSLVPGEDFEIVVVSIDPTETSGAAAKALATYANRYGRPSGANGWHFLVGKEDSIRSLAGAAGFRYVHDTETDEYGHASGFFVLTPKGVLSRVFYGLEHSASDLRLALVESSEERIGSLVDQVLLLCFHYDPATGKYGFAIMNAIRGVGFLTIASIVLLFLVLRRRERGVVRPGTAR
jgi:protein SCO1/2